MKMIILLLFMIVVLLTAPKIEESYVAYKIIKKPTINSLITLNAIKYGVAESTLHRVIKCESSYNTKAVGDGGTSFGLVQINLLAHPEVTKTEAFDQEFAINFLASNLAKGKGGMWTCF